MTVKITSPQAAVSGGHMSGPVVTLFEKYGAGARYVGPRVAAALGVEWMIRPFPPPISRVPNTPAEVRLVIKGAVWNVS